MKRNIENKEYDVVVIGGGLSGICAAIAAARHGAKTALVQDRPVLGGNASSEIKMHICGADIHATKPNTRETGIIEELLLTNRIRNPQQSFSVQDYVFEEIVRAEPNLDLYLNTRMRDVQMKDNVIVSIDDNRKIILFLRSLFCRYDGRRIFGILCGSRIYVRQRKPI